MAEKWQPIETAPWDEPVVLYERGAADGRQFQLACRYSDDPDGDWYPWDTDQGAPIVMQPTHWARIPKE